MTLRARTVLRLAVVVLAALLAVQLPGALGSLARPTAALSAELHHSLATGAVPASASRVVPAVHPNVPCPALYPAYIQLGKLWPLAPNQARQYPCPPTGLDEIHGSFFSNQPGSGERMSVPIHLPVDGRAGFNTSGEMVNVTGGFYVGMVLAGDFRSAWNQSYAQVMFTPNGTGTSMTYEEDLALWSMLNSSSFSTGSCPADAINFTWNGTYWCEVDEIHDGVGAMLVNTLPAGDYVNVTFLGKAHTGGAAELWVNDSTHSTDSANWTFNPAVDDGSAGTTLTGKYKFEPAFKSSCPVTCILNWSMPFGLGVGFEMCPGASIVAACDSYNQVSWILLHPIEVGIPRYFTGGSYSGEYRYFAPESASGACSTIQPPGTVTGCINFFTMGGTGYYPFFSFNGSVLNFGTNYSFTTSLFGGSNVQFFSNGQLNDITPFYIDRVHNNSRAGFVASGNPIDVSARAQDLGTVTSVNLTYVVGTSAPATLVMTRTSGTASLGTYAATIPGGGGDGRIRFNITGLNGAGAVVTTANSTVQRGPLPTFQVNVTTGPPACAKVTINGSTFHNGGVDPVIPGFYPVTVQGCYPYVFGGFSVSAGLEITSTGSLTGNLTVSASGTLNASWNYIRPLDSITVYTNPASCGSVKLNGQFYNNSRSLQLYDSLTYPISVGATCAGDGSFAGWNFTGNFSIVGGNFTPMGNGSLTANFVPSNQAYTLTFYTGPANCGAVLFRGAGYTNNQALGVLAGTYSLGSLACPHFAFRNFSSGGGVTFTATTLTVSSAGWIRETNYHLTEIAFATNPPGCGSITFDGMTYVNGQSIVVANNSTHSISATPCKGYSLFGFNTTGMLTVIGSILIANGSGTLLAVFFPGTSSTFVAFLTDPSSCGTIYLAGLTYHNSNFTSVPPGSVYPISATPCGGYGFVAWSVSSIQTNGIAIVGGKAYINASGSIEAIFRPIVAVLLFTTPASCGSILLNGVGYTNNQTAFLASDATYGLQALPCSHYVFSGWLNTSSSIINGGTVLFLSASSLTALFVPARYPVAVAITPSTCGALLVNGAYASNGTTLQLQFGNYAIANRPCLGDHLESYSASGSVSVNGSTLTVAGAGQLAALFLPVAPTLTLSAPTSTFAGETVGFLAIVAVPVPPYSNYSYAWSFGDGAVLNSKLNLTSHVYATPGTYVVKVVVTDPYQRHANASAAINVVSASTSSSSIPLSSLELVAGIGIAIAVAIGIGALVVRRQPPAPPESTLALPDENEAEVQVPAPGSPDAPP